MIRTSRRGFLGAIISSALAPAIVTAQTTSRVGKAPEMRSPPIVRAGPLRGMPSAPGNHIAIIEALGQDKWVNLGPASPDPLWGGSIGRSWGPKMPYATALGVALHYGQGPHGRVAPNGRYDDIFAYDFYGHRWINIDPGINTTTFVSDVQSGAIRIDPVKGWLVYTANGRPVHAYGVHAYQVGYYDSDTSTWVFKGWPTGRGGDQFVNDPNWYKPNPNWYYPAIGILNTQPQVLGGDFICFKFNALTGELSRDKNNHGAMFYVPSQRAPWLLWQGKTYIGTLAQPTGSPPPVYGVHDFSACQDLTRDRIYCGNPPGKDPYHDVFVYDVAANAWTHPTTSGTGTMPPTNNCLAHFDSRADRMLTFVHDSGKMIVNAWNPNSLAWESSTPFPAVPVSGRVFAGFYEPSKNVHMLYSASDGAVGEWWAYRHK